MAEFSNQKDPFATSPMAGQNEAVLVELLTAFGAGVATLAADGTMVSWSPEATSITGYDASQINAIGFAQLFHSPHRIVEMIARAQQGVPTASERLTCHGVDGQRMPLTLWCLPLGRGDGGAAHSLMIMQAPSDATCQADTAHARPRLELLGQLAGSVSHAIRNPLSAVSLHSEILAEELSQSRNSNREQLLESLAVIRAGMARTAAMVQHYLTLARLSVVSRMPNDVGGFLEAFRQETRERLAALHLSVQLQGVESLGAVGMDTTMCHQVLLHLLESSSEGLPRGGAITVCGRQTEGAIHLDIRVAADEVREPEIRDSRSAVPPPDTEGWGFALFLARELVIAHHGEIALSHQPGTGTTVSVTLPLLRVDACPERSAGQHDQPGARHRDHPLRG